MTNKVKFIEFPFEYQGVHFVSKIAETCSNLPQILNLGEGFIEMNKSAINEIIPNLVSLNLEQLQERLDFINDGGTEMFLEIGHTTLAGAR